MALVNSKKYEEAIAICWREMSNSKSMKHGVYAYRLYETYRCMGESPKANVLIAHLVSNMEKTELDSLAKLTFSSCIIEQASLNHDSELVQKTIKKYQSIGDEFNYGMTMCGLQESYSDEQSKAISSLW